MIPIFIEVPDSNPAEPDSGTCLLNGGHIRGFIVENDEIKALLPDASGRVQEVEVWLSLPEIRARIDIEIARVSRLIMQSLRQ